MRARLAGRPVAVKWRHRSWLEGAAGRQNLSALRSLDMAHVVAECPPLDWAPRPVPEVTTSWSVIRLHGRNAVGWQRGAGVEAPYDFLYSEDELRERAGQARGIAAQVDRLSLMFNNCTRGQAAANAGRMVDLLAAG